MTQQLRPGDPAPDFTLPSADGTPTSLASLRGRRVVLYFYPAAGTPGCTTEACDFRDSLASLRASGISVIGDYLDEDELDSEDYVLPVSAHRLATTEDFLPILDGYPTKFRAGDRFAYCNAGFVVLALMAERVSGRGYHELVREIVCSPAGMVDTGFLRSDALPGRAALGYVEVQGHWRTNVFHLPVVATGDGGAYTTAADMERFWAALTSGRIVGLETLAEMCRGRTDPEPGESRCYGLGVWLEADSPRITTSGADAGVSFWSSHHPRRATTATVISTTIGGAWPVVEIVQSHS